MMMSREPTTANTLNLRLRLTEGRFAVCRLDATAPVPDWAAQDSRFFSITRTSDELSIVCPEEVVAPGVKSEAGWRLFRMEGPFDFALTGILLSVLQPLNAAGVSLLAISTYDTDYFLVKDQSVEKAVGALSAAGHTVTRD